MNIAERLRDGVNRHYGKDPAGLMNEAADEIERLHDEAEHQLYKRRDAEEEVERLRKALQIIKKLPNSESAYGTIQVVINDALNGDE